MKREKDRIIDSIINNNQDKKVLLDLLINKNYTIIQEIAKELNTKVKEKEITKNIENNYLTFVASNIIDTDIFNEDMSLKALYSFLHGYESNLVYHLSFDLDYIFNASMLNKAEDKILLVLLSSNNENANISFTILTRRIKDETFSYSYLDENNIIKYFIESSLREEKSALTKVINNPEFIKLFESNNISVTSLLEWTQHLKQNRKTIIDTNKFKKAINTNELNKIAALLSREEVKYAWKNTLIKNRFITQSLRFDCLDKQTQEQILEDPETIKYLPLVTIEEFISGFDNKVQLYNSKEMIFLYLDKLTKDSLQSTHNIFDTITNFELKNLIEDVYFDYAKEPVILYLIKNLTERQIDIICENENIHNQIMSIKDVNYFHYLPITIQEQVLVTRKSMNDILFLPLLVNSKSELIKKQFDDNEKLYHSFVKYITREDLSVDEISNIINNLPADYYKKLIKEDLFKLNGKTLLSLLSSNIDIARQGILNNSESCIKLIDSINSTNMNDYLNCLYKLTDSERINLITQANTDNIEVLCATINTLDDKHKKEIYNNKSIREKVLFASNKYYNMDKYIIEYLFNNEQEITKLSAEKLVDLLLKTNIKDNIRILKDKRSLEKIIKSSKKNDGIKNVILNNPSLLSYVITPDNMDFIPRETLISIIDTLPINDKKYLCQNEYVLKVIFNDRVLKTYKNLYEKNNYLFNTLDFEFLDDETINVKFNVLEYLTENKDIQRLYVNIRKNLKIGYKFIFTMTSLVNEIDPYALKDILTMIDESLVNKNRNRIGNFEKIFKDIDIDNLTIKEYSKIINYLLYLIPKYNTNGNNHIRKLERELIPESFAELKTFEKTYDDYYTKKLTYSDQKSYMNNYLLKNFKISLDEAKVLVNRYSLNGIDISKNKDLIFVQKISNIINNGEYSSKETPLTIVDLFKKDKAIKAIYANILNYEINNSTNNLKQQTLKVSGQDIKVYSAKDRFTYLVTRYNLNDLKVNDYYNEWNNYLSSLDTNYLKTSIISNDNISSTTKSEILFGFNSIDNNSILRMAPYRLDDHNDLFMCPRSIINNTRETRNNVLIDKYERRLKLKSSTPYIIPDSIIVYKNDLYDENDNIKRTYLELIAKISRDFINRYHMNGLAIIVIDREYIANNELTKINKNINKYLDNKNVKLYSKIIKKYLNNKSGYILSNSSLAYHFDNKTIIDPLIKRINESNSISELDSLRRLLAEENSKREKVKVNISYEDIDFEKIFKIIDKRKEELMINKKD